MRTLNSTGPNKPRSARAAGALAAGLLAAPLLIHFAAVHRHAGLAAAALSLLVLPALFAAGRRRQWGAVLMLLLVVTAGWLLIGGLSLLYALPVVINLALCCLFASTLRRGRKPVICAFLEGQQDRAVSAAQYRYARGVTWVWTLFFAAMGVQTLLLARYAPVEVWSLFVNGINYGLVLILFALEYQVRRRVLPEVRHDGFFAFLRSLVRTDFRSLLQPSS